MLLGIMAKVALSAIFGVLGGAMLAPSLNWTEHRAWRITSAALITAGFVVAISSPPGISTWLICTAAGIVLGVVLTLTR